jgi:hypothetical protein
MDTLKLIREQQAINRLQYAKKRQAEIDAEESKEQLSGRILGTNAELGAVMVELDNGGTLACRSVTSGNLKPSSRAIVTLNGSQAWVDGMPN